VADRTIIHQWLGPNHRLTLWRVETGPHQDFYTQNLGWIVEAGETWQAWLAPSVTHPLGRYLRTLDDRLAAARTLCAHLRIEMPELPTVDGE
jgi:hypothetical protein